MKNKGLRTISGMLAAAISLSAMSSFPIYADTSSIVSSDFRKGTSNTDYPRITLVAANVASDYTSTYKFSLTRSDT